MNLLLLSTSASYHPGPRARWIPLATIAQHHGVQTQLACLHPDYGNISDKTQSVSGVSITYISQMHIHRNELPRTGVSLIATALIASMRMARYAITYHPQVIGICKAQPINGLAALIAHRRTGASVILDVDDDESQSHQFAYAWQRRFVAIIEHSLPAKARSVSAASHWHTTQLIQAGHIHTAHIPNGVNPVQTLPHPIPRLPATYIAYVGRIAFNTHAVDILIEALAHTKTPVPLVIAGSGPDANAMHTHIHQLGLASRCIWLGQVSPATAQAVIAHAHATIDPVRDTPAAAARYPLKIIESLAHGVPVITSSIGDRAMMIGTHGALVAAGNVIALAHAIDEIVAQPRMVRTEGQSRVAHLTWQKVGSDWVNHHRLCAQH